MALIPTAGRSQTAGFGCTLCGQRHPWAAGCSTEKVLPCCFDLTRQITQEITERLGALPKPALPQLDQSLLRPWVEAAVQKCQLVSREEFDAQNRSAVAHAIKSGSSGSSISPAGSQNSTPSPALKTMPRRRMSECQAIKTS